MRCLNMRRLLSEMKSTEVSDILAPKCRPTSDVSLSKEVSETAVEVVTSASSSVRYEV